MEQNMHYVGPVAEASVEERSDFIWKCYAHVVGGILAFVAIESYLFSSGAAEPIITAMFKLPWLAILAIFIGVSWGAAHVAHRVESKPAQYAAYGALVVVEAIIFLPMLYIADSMGGGIIERAAGVTIIGCVGLIATAMITRKDFSFLRGMLVWGGLLAMGGIVASLIMGFELGTWFSVAMIGFAGVAVLYDTSNIMHHYPQDRYVGAAMALFASIALMFWYILRLFISRD